MPTKRMETSCFSSIWNDGRNTTMELIARENLDEIHQIFQDKFNGMHRWSIVKEVPDEHVIHVEKIAKSGLGDDGFQL
jgi:hypothetical protein